MGRVDRAQKQAEIDANFKAFQRMLPELMATRAGKFALLRHQALVQFFDTPRDALVFGQQVFPDGVFSIQEVTQKLIDQGWFSYAAADHKLQS